MNYRQILHLLLNMADSFKTLTVSHKWLNTNELSNFIIRHDDEDQLIKRLENLMTYANQEEIVYLVTCNRVMIILYGREDLDKTKAINLFRLINPKLNRSEHLNLQKVIQLKSGLTAVNHLMEVISSIDSLVVGEREIFRQFREAYDFSVKHKLSGDNMRILEKCSVLAAKDVFTKTQIGAKPVSVASLAIQEFLKRQLNKESRILLVGAGETNTKVGRFLIKYGYNNLVVFNRSLDNAQALSHELNAEAFYLADLEDYDKVFEAIVTCTSSQDPIITSTLWEKLNPTSRSKVIIDLSIPNNVSQEVAQSNSADYINISTIQQMAEENLKFRNSNIVSARIILRVHVDEFAHMYERRKVERAFKHLPLEIQAVKERALENVYKDQIESMPAEAQALITEICSYMEKKCIAVPMRLAKSVV